MPGVVAGERPPGAREMQSQLVVQPGVLDLAAERAEDLVQARVQVVRPVLMRLARDLVERLARERDRVAERDGPRVRVSESLATARTRVASGFRRTLELTPEHLPTARVRGTVVDADGAPVAAQVVLLGPKGRGGYHDARCEFETGDFELGPLPPGEYTLRLRPDELPSLSRTVELLQDDVLDLGEWRLGRASHIELVVDGRDGPGPFDAVTLFERKGPEVWTRPRRFEHEELATLRAWPGAYVLRASGPEVCTEIAGLELVAGSPTRVALTSHPGVECTFVLLPGDDPLPPLLSVSVIDANERGVASWSEGTATEGPRFTRRLRAGAYTAIVRARKGEITRVPFSVGTEPPSIELPLD